jgi:hypothetical protein
MGIGSLCKSSLGVAEWCKDSLLLELELLELVVGAQ